jgi:transposase-like protein
MKLSKTGYLILKDRRIKGEVCNAIGIKENTLYYWIKIESQRLTQMGVLDVLSREGGVTIEQLIEVESKDTIAA